MSLRPRFHITPPSGRLNDPNGMFIDGADLHVYYQHDPCFPHLPKQTGWGHAVINLERPEPPRHFPDALYPIRPWDLNGCYSGGAIRAGHNGEDIWLFYTGNLKVDGRRVPSQNRVRVTELGEMGGVYTHDDVPLIPDAPDGYTGHVRDPQISLVAATAGSAESPRWRMVLGAQTEAEQGAVLVYESSDLEHWELQGPMTFVGGEVPGGYMWECPNLVRMRDADGRDKDVLVICPQFEDRDECGYIVGQLNGTTFTVEQSYRLLDHGHAFYAPQLIPVGGVGDAIMVGWMGLPAQDDTPTVAEGWVHCLTMPRRLTLDHGVLRQEPWWGDFPGAVRVSEPGVWTLVDGECELLVVDWDGQRVTVTRADGEERVASASGPVTLTADGCAVEIFAGDASFAVPVDGVGEWHARTGMN